MLGDYAAVVGERFLVFAVGRQRIAGGTPMVATSTRLRLLIVLLALSCLALPWSTVTVNSSTVAATTL